MVIHTAFYWIAGYFLLGTVGTAIANKNADKKTKTERIVKLAVHFFIVNGIAIIITYFLPYFYLLAAGIVVFGLFEICYTMHFQKKQLVLNITTLVLYFLIAAGFVAMALSENGNALLFIFLCVFIFDGFSQISGQLFGKTKLFPIVSPGKTTEGLVGGIIICFVTAFCIRNWIEISSGELILIISILILGAIAGDWLTSYYKRQHHIKDFSRLIPGHGGFLDRFDSWLTSAAVIYFLSKLDVLPLHF